MPISNKDRERLRGLAKRVAEIAALPVQAERIALWKKHNSLRRARPMILVFPEGSWRELLPDSALLCEGKGARDIEYALRRRIYYHDYIRDDTVIEKAWFVSKEVSDTGWGLEPRHIPPSEPTGAWKFDPVILDPADLKKLVYPRALHDEKATRENLAEAQDLFGDVLDVRLKGVSHVGFHLMSVYCHRRGLLEVMQDMYENPAMLHDAMAFIEEGFRVLRRQWQEMDLLDLNNDNTYQSSGGVGWTDELPRHVAHPPSGVSSLSDVAQPPSAEKKRSHRAAGVPHQKQPQPGAAAPHQPVKPADLWASAESQEMAQVSPEMHREFVMQYEARLLAPFALTGYGCCEDLTRKMDDVLAMPHIRRISIAPSADVEKCAEQVGRKAIFSWKPQPSHLVGEFDDKKVRDYIQHTLDAAKAGGCVLEMILKDTHTCENHPERFTRWTEIARELVDGR